MGARGHPGAEACAGVPHPVFPGAGRTAALPTGGVDSGRPPAGTHAGTVTQDPVGQHARHKKPAVILLSGGLDSATVLAIAREADYACHALSLDYGQRHTAELAAAARVARSLGAVEHRVMRLGLGDIGGSALTDASIAVPESPTDGIPVTYVPARNTVMLALALAWAEVLGARDIFIGVNALDYSGYPDCRPEFIEAFERMAYLATAYGVEQGEKIWVFLS